MRACRNRCHALKAARLDQRIALPERSTLGVACWCVRTPLGQWNRNGPGLVGSMTFRKAIGETPACGSDCPGWSVRCCSARCRSTVTVESNPMLRPLPALCANSLEVQPGGVDRTSKVNTSALRDRLLLADSDRRRTSPASLSGSLRRTYIGGRTAPRHAVVRSGCPAKPARLPLVRNDGQPGSGNDRLEPRV